MPVGNATNVRNRQPNLQVVEGGAAKAVPGFDVKGKPLGDDAVWNRFVGAERRPVNTAHAATSQKIDGWERNQLLRLAKDQPQEFIQRLLADSANGSPVEVSFSKEVKGSGVFRLGFSAEDGKFETTARFEVYNNRADRYLKPYMAKDGREKGVRSSVQLALTGELTKDGGLSDVRIEISARDLPKFEGGRILELEKLQKELKAALRADVGKAQREEDVLGVVDELVDRLSSFPLPFLMKAIEQDDELEITIKPKDHSVVAKADIGNGRYAISLSDILGDDNADEPKIGAKMTGGVKGDVISIDALAVGNEHPLSLEWSEDGQPKVFRTNPETGEKRPVNDHFGEVIQYLPLAMALASGQGPF